MEKREIPRLHKCLTVAGEIYNRSISMPMTELYYETLKEYEITEIEKAIKFHIKNTETGQFFPKPADIIRQLFATRERRIY